MRRVVTKWGISSFAIPLAALAGVAGCAAVAAGPAPGVRFGAVPVDGGELAYEAAGRGPALVLVHGGFVDRRLWDDHFRDLARDHRVIRYDVRGLGQSSRPTGAFSHVDDLHRVMTHLNLDRAALVGLSLGGMIATDYALEHPERVTALVLVGSGLRGVSVRPDSGLMTAFARAYRLGETDPTRAVDFILDSLGMGSADPRARERLRVMVASNLRGWMSSPPRLQRWPEPATAQRLSQIRVPTLVVVGTADARPLHVFADTLAARIPGARRDSIAGARHHPPVERRAEFNRILRRFLREVGR